MDAGDGWLPGYAVRDPMGRWHFERAHAAIDDATDVLGIREDIEAAASALDLTPPTTLRDAYEGAADDFDDARDLAEEQLATVGAIAAATEHVGAERGLLASIGLIGEDPAAAVEAAKDAFEAGDLEASDAELDTANALLAGADDAGRGRVAGGGIAAAGLVAVGAGVVFGVRRWRRRPVAAEALPAGPVMMATPLRGLRPMLPADARDRSADGAGRRRTVRYTRRPTAADGRARRAGRRGTRRRRRNVRHAG